MMTFVARRWLASGVSLAVAILITAGLLSYALALHPASHLSGWVLLAAMVFLAAYNVRKKLTYPPLFSASTWLQAHIYVGYVSIVIFLFHIGLRMPNGPFEQLFAAIYATIVLSGVFGLALSRMAPSRLSVRGEEVIFERIGWFRRRLQEQAEGLVLESAETGAATLADFYRDRLVRFFAEPRHYWRHLLQSKRPLNRLRGALTAQDRYLNDDERKVAVGLAELIDLKDALDYHRAIQGTLKGWLFVHIPLTYLLLLFAAVHVVLVHAFSGGLP